MTEKQIEQKAEGYSDAFIAKGVAKASYIKGYKEATKDLEKQIQIDAEQIRALQKQNGELTDKVKELEAQIEKMKCCANCKKYWCMCEYGDREMQICDKWEIKEK